MNPLVAQFTSVPLKETIDKKYPTDGPVTVLNAFCYKQEDQSNESVQELKNAIHEAHRILSQSPFIHSDGCTNPTECEIENGICPYLLESDQCPPRALVVSAFQALDTVACCLEPSSQDALGYVSAILKRGVFGTHPMVVNRKQHSRVHGSSCAELQSLSEKKSTEGDGNESLWGNRVANAQESLVNVDSDVKLWKARIKKERKSLSKLREKLSDLDKYTCELRSTYTEIESAIREVTVEQHNTQSELDVQQKMNMDLKEKIEHLKLSIENVKPQLDNKGLVAKRDEMNELSQKLLIASEGSIGGKVSDFYVSVDQLNELNKNYEKVCKLMSTLGELDKLQDARLGDDNRRVSRARQNLNMLNEQLESLKHEFDKVAASSTPRPSWREIEGSDMLPGLCKCIPNGAIADLANQELQVGTESSWGAEVTGNDFPRGYTSLVVDTMIGIIERDDRENELVEEVNSAKSHIALMQVETSELEQRIAALKIDYAELLQNEQENGDTGKYQSRKDVKVHDTRDAVGNTKTLGGIAKLVVGKRDRAGSNSGSQNGVAKATKRFTENLLRQSKLSRMKVKGNTKKQKCEAQQKKKKLPKQRRTLRKSRIVKESSTNDSHVEASNRSTVPTTDDAGENYSDEQQEPNEYYIPLGTQENIPKFLQTNKKVKKTDMTKVQVETLVREILALHSSPISNIDTDKKLDTCTKLYIDKLASRGTSTALEIGYDFMNGLEQYIWDADIENFLLVLTGKLPDSLHESQKQLIQKLEEKIKELDKTECAYVRRLQVSSMTEIAAGNQTATGYVSLLNFRVALRALFPIKTENALDRLVNAAKRDLQTVSGLGNPNTSEAVKYGVLFVETEELDQSEFVEEIRSQHVSELREYIKNIKRSISGCSVDEKGKCKLADIKLCIKLALPYSEPQEINQMVNAVVAVLSPPKKAKRGKRLNNRNLGRTDISTSRTEKPSILNDGNHDDSMKVTLASFLEHFQQQLPVTLLCNSDANVVISDISTELMSEIETVIDQASVDSGASPPNVMHRLNRTGGLTRRKAETKLRISTTDLTGFTVPKDPENNAMEEQKAQLSLLRSRKLHRKLAKEERLRRYEALLGVYS